MQQAILKYTYEMQTMRKIRGVILYTFHAAFSAFRVLFFPRACMHSGQNWNRQNPLDRSQAIETVPASPQHKCVHTHTHIERNNVHQVGFTKSNRYNVRSARSAQQQQHQEEEKPHSLWICECAEPVGSLFFLFYPLRKYLCEHATLNLSIASDIRHTSTLLRVRQWQYATSKKNERDIHEWGIAF